MTAEPRRDVPPADLGGALAEALPGPGEPEAVTLLEAAGRVPAEDVTAPHDLPPFPTARVDGYAVAAAAPGRSLAVASRAVPGDAPPAPLNDGEACRVMTGAPLPPGAAGVVPREAADETVPGRVRLGDADPVPPVAPGGRVARGAVLARAGVPLGAVDVGRLADCGLARLRAFPRPRVDLLGVGSELQTLPDRAPAPSGPVPPHYNSNGYVLAALVRAAGGLGRLLPPAPDAVGSIAAVLAGSEAELIVTTGGTAKGDHDHTEAAAREAGFRMRIEGVAARPARTARVAVRGAQVLVCLPGSPGAVPVLFALLAGPALRRLGGVAAFAPRWRRARLAAPVPEPRPEPVLSHAVLELEEGAFRVRAARLPGNGFVLLPAGEAPLPAGTPVPVLWGEGAVPTDAAGG